MLLRALKPKQSPALRSSGLITCFCLLYIHKGSSNYSAQGKLEPSTGQDVMAHGGYRDLTAALATRRATHRLTC